MEEERKREGFERRDPECDGMRTSATVNEGTCRWTPQDLVRKRSTLPSVIFASRMRKTSGIVLSVHHLPRRILLSVLDLSSFLHVRSKEKEEERDKEWSEKRLGSFPTMAFFPDSFLCDTCSSFPASEGDRMHPSIRSKPIHPRREPSSSVPSSHRLIKR